MRGPYHPPNNRRMGHFSPNPAFFGIFLFLKLQFSKLHPRVWFLPRGHFMRGHWLNASMAKILSGKNRFSILNFLASRPFLVSCCNSDKIQTKIQTKLRQNSDNKLQTTFRQQNSDTNSDRNSDKNSDKCLNSDNKVQTKNSDTF